MSLNRAATQILRAPVKSCSAILRQNQATASRLAALPRAGKSTLASNAGAGANVCPCCFGAVHKREGARVPGAMQPFFRSFASSSSGPSVVTLIKADHREAEQLFDKYSKTTDATEKDTIAHKLIKAISQHGAQEEMSIYPWMKEHDANTKKMVDHGIHEHQKVKEDLAKLDKMKAGDAGFDSTIQRLWKDLSHHIKEEETSILPTLEKIASKSQLSELGAKFTEMKNIAPSRPHPHGPSAGGIGTKMANAGAKVVDDARDAMQGRPKK